MSHVIPRPYREILTIPAAVVFKSEDEQRADWINDMAYNNDNDTPSAAKVKRENIQIWVTATLRVCLAAAAFFALRHYGASMAVGGVLGSFLSLPVTLIAVGSYAVYQAAVLCIHALATGIIAKLAQAFICFA